MHFSSSAPSSPRPTDPTTCDADSDRRHPKKRERPLARPGAYRRAPPVPRRLCRRPCLLAGAALGPASAAPPLYLATTVAYSLSIKRIPSPRRINYRPSLSGRVGAGAVAIPVFVSPWLFSFSLLFFLSLALSKRHVELIEGDR